MQKQIKQVAEFHDVFGIKNAEFPTTGTLELAEKRFAFLKEENEEYLQAVKDKDIVGILDSLLDQLYFVFGTANLHGLQKLLEIGFDEVQRSNMSKLDENGKAIINGQNGILDTSKPLGKVLKSKLYSEPDLRQFFTVDKYQ